jgi:hypothetical protein
MDICRDDMSTHTHTGGYCRYIYTHTCICRRSSSSPSYLSLSLPTTVAAHVYSLVIVFKTLSDRKPDIKCGIFAYAAEGFGSLVGTLSAFGY